MLTELKMNLYMRRFSFIYTSTWLVQKVRHFLLDWCYPLKSCVHCARKYFSRQNISETEGSHQRISRQIKSKDWMKLFVWRWYCFSIYPSYLVDHNTISWTFYSNRDIFSETNIASSGSQRNEGSHQRIFCQIKSKDWTNLFLWWTNMILFDIEDFSLSSKILKCIGRSNWLGVYRRTAEPKLVR